MSSGCRLSSCAVGIAQWNGEPRGRWEGNTLVVESRYFPDRPADRFRHIWRAPASTVHVVERFTRVGAETIDYAATITDPVRFARPWTVRFVLSNDPAGRGVTPGHLFEYGCHEDRPTRTQTDVVDPVVRTPTPA